jgi:hypothetical protein
MRTRSNHSSILRTTLSCRQLVPSANFCQVSHIFRIVWSVHNNKCWLWAPHNHVSCQWAAHNNKCCLWDSHNCVPSQWSGACRCQGLLRTTLDASCGCTAHSHTIQMPGIRLSYSLTYPLPTSHTWPHYSLMQPTRPKLTCLKSDRFSFGLHTTKHLCCGFIPAMCLASGLRLHVSVCLLP